MSWKQNKQNISLLLTVFHTSIKHGVHFVKLIELFERSSEYLKIDTQIMNLSQSFLSGVRIPIVMYEIIVQSHHRGHDNVQ